MSEKKYILSSSDLSDFCLEASKGGSCRSANQQFVDAWFAAHEYHEPTQHTQCCPCGARRVGCVVVDHGLHGPEPRCPGDVWTVSYRCSVCQGHIDKDDAYCKRCGVRLEK